MWLAFTYSFINWHKCILKLRIVIRFLEFEQSVLKSDRVRYLDYSGTFIDRNIWSKIIFIKVEVHEKLFFAQKIENYVKFNRPKGFFHFKDCFQVFTHF